MFDKSLVKTTGQWWKLQLSFWGIIVGRDRMVFAEIFSNGSLSRIAPWRQEQ